LNFVDKLIVEGVDTVELLQDIYINEPHTLKGKLGFGLGHMKKLEKHFRGLCASSPGGAPVAPLSALPVIGDEEQAVKALFEVREADTLGKGRDVDPGRAPYNAISVVRVWRLDSQSQQRRYDDAKSRVKLAYSQDAQWLVANWEVLAAKGRGIPPHEYLKQMMTVVQGLLKKALPPPLNVVSGLLTRVLEQATAAAVQFASTDEPEELRQCLEQIYTGLYAVLHHLDGIKQLVGLAAGILPIATQVLKEVEDAIKLCLRALGGLMEKPSTITVHTLLDVKSDFWYDELDREVNEKLLLHGTKPEFAFDILNNALDEHFSSLNGMFGPGIYLAEMVEKIDQYTTVDANPTPSLKQLHELLYPRHDHPGDVHYAFVCQAVLGVPVRTKDGVNGLAPHQGEVFRAGIDRRELAIMRGATHGTSYHSLVAELGVSLARFREFMLFHGDRVKIKYVVAYQRDWRS